MKKLLFILFISLSFIACNKQIKGNYTEYTVEQTLSTKLCVIDFSSCVTLGHFRHLIYQNGNLRYIDVEQKDSVIGIKKLGLVEYEDKEIYDDVYTDTTYTDIAWVDINGLKFFFNNTTREVIMIVQHIKTEHNDSSINEIYDIIDKEMINKQYPWMTTIDEYAKKYK